MEKKKAMLRKLTDEEKKSILVLILVNILANGFLLILSGTFWDDWAYVDHDVNQLWNQFVPAGIPSRIFVIQSVWWIPLWGYRWAVFVLYSVISIVYYKILVNTGFATCKEALLISCIFSVVPVNVTRLSLCNYECTVGFTFFFLGTYLLVKYLNGARITCRIISVICFLFSFLLNADLFFYVLPCLYIVYREVKENKSIGYLIHRLFFYLDYILAPILFYMAKQALFPVYGAYEDYNVVTIWKCIWAIKNVIKYIVPQFVAVCMQFFCWTGKSRKIYFLIFSLATLFSICVAVFRKRKGNEKKELFFLLIGSLSFAIGMYPYVVIRQGELSTSGVGSRDSMLLPVGFSLIVFSVIDYLKENKYVSRSLATVVLALGIISFNYSYLGFQRVDYWQESLRCELKKNDSLKEKENLLLLTDDTFDVDYGIRFYVLNGIAAHVYGDQTRLIMFGYDGLNVLNHEVRQYFKDGTYCCDDYDITNHDLDGIMYFNCPLLSLEYTMKLKWLELFDHVQYESLVNDLGELKFYDIDSAEAQRLLDGYEY